MAFTREQLKPPAELREHSVLGSWASPVPNLLAEVALLPLRISRHRGLRGSKCQPQSDAGPVSYSSTSLFPGLVKDTGSRTDRRRTLTLSTKDSWHTEETALPLGVKRFRGRVCMPSLSDCMRGSKKSIPHPSEYESQGLPATPAVYLFAEQESQAWHAWPFPD